MIWSLKVTEGQTEYSIRSAINDFLLTFHSNSSAISHGIRDSLQMTLIWLFMVAESQTDHSIRSATNEFLLSFDSNYGAISHGDRVFQQITLIWPFKVTEDQTDHSIRSAYNNFLLTFHSNYSAISLRLRYIRRQNSEDFAGILTFDLSKVKLLDWHKLTLNGALAPVVALLMSYCASRFVHPFGLNIK